MCLIVMKGMIVALNAQRIIGVDGKIPWKHDGDLKRFKEITEHNTVIMGRKTFESIGSPLPSRKNIVLSKTMESSTSEVVVKRTILEALNEAENDVWFIGGAKVYLDAFKYVDVMDVTLVPNFFFNLPSDDSVVLFPNLPGIDDWECGEWRDHPYNSNLLVNRFFRPKSQD